MVTLDEDAFKQLLELDDDDAHTFSKSIVDEFFKDVGGTMATIRYELRSGNLPKVGSLGHFLKGSAASIGAAKVRDICDQIQHYEICCPRGDTVTKYLNNLVEALDISLKEAEQCIYDEFRKLAC